MHQYMHNAKYGNPGGVHTMRPQFVMKGEQVFKSEYHPDVRANSEWNAGHVRGVKNIPLSELTDRLDELSTTQPIVLHCQGGGRSSIAASVLREKGFVDVINLSGGFGAWSKEGLPTEK